MKHFYFTEKQYKNILKRLSNNEDNKYKLSNQLDEENEGEKHDEKWMELSEKSKEYKMIENSIGFKNNSKLKINKVYGVDSGEHFIAEIYGGLNGSGKWENYLNDIEKIFKNINDSWLIDLINDPPDDVWTIKIGFRVNKEKINEGCWGYNPFDSDQILDDCHEFAEKTLEWLIENIKKKLKQKYGIPTDYIFGYMGIIVQLLNMEHVFDEYLFNNDNWFNLKDAVDNGYKYCEKHKDKYKEPEKFIKNLKKIKKDIDKLLDNKFLRKAIENRKKRNINESFNFIEPNKILIIKNYLDNNFVRAGIDIIGSDSLPQKKPVIGMKNSNGEIVKNFTPQQIFFLLQEKFKKIYDNKEKRNKLLKQVIIDWFNDKITKEGLLSVNQY